VMGSALGSSSAPALGRDIFVVCPGSRSVPIAWSTYDDTFPHLGMEDPAFRSVPGQKNVLGAPFVDVNPLNGVL